MEMLFILWSCLIVQRESNLSYYDGWKGKLPVHLGSYDQRILSFFQGIEKSNRHIYLWGFGDNQLFTHSARINTVWTREIKYSRYLFFVSISRIFKKRYFNFIFFIFCYHHFPSTWHLSVFPAAAAFSDVVWFFFLIAIYDWILTLRNNQT